MKKLLKKIVTSILAGTMILSLGNVISVNAQEIDDIEEQNYVGDFVENQSNGDMYEPNNEPGEATPSRYNKVTYGSIHDANDEDWYEMDITDASVRLSIILTNIPSGCDYNLVLLKCDSSGNTTYEYSDNKTGTLSETIDITVPSEGKYYVVVRPADTLENNYSESNYKLYFGTYYRNGGYGWIDPGYDINFGYHKQGNTVNYYSDWYTIDLTNNTNIPNGALVTEFSLDNQGHGGTYSGFYKQLRANGSGVQFPDKSGGIEVMYSNKSGNYPVKQVWSFRGYLKVSIYFVWEPQYFIMYRYPVTIENLRFVK